MSPSFPGAGGAVVRPAKVVGVGGVAGQRRRVLALTAQRLLERISAMRATFIARATRGLLDN